MAPGLGAIHHAAFLRIEGQQRALGRGKTRWSKATVADVRHFAIAQVVVTVIFSQHHGVKDGVSVNSFLDTFGPKIKLQPPRHTVARVSPGRVLCIHAAQSARSHCIDAETRAAPGGVLPPYQRS